MRDKLVQLQSTLSLIETKGENTLIMADCLRFLNQCIAECEDKTDQVTEPEKQTD